MKSCIYEGQVRHTRTKPVGHTFNYRLFMMYLDLDELPTTKLRHMVTSPANMYLSPRERPKGAMREMPNLMEAEDIETVDQAGQMINHGRHWIGLDRVMQAQRIGHFRPGAFVVGEIAVSEGTTLRVPRDR